MHRQSILTRVLLGLAAVTVLCPVTAGATDHRELTVTARVINTLSQDIGFVAVSETEQGIIIQVDVSQLAPGKHAFHLHETAVCEPPHFRSAGGHLNPTDAAHGYLREDGAHAGDMPNQIVDGQGHLLVSVFNDEVRLREGPVQLFDADGTALIIHAGYDDYTTQPSGDAGARVACAAFDGKLLERAVRTQPHTD